MSATKQITVLALSLFAAGCLASTPEQKYPDNVYETLGVHNPRGCEIPERCIGDRPEGSPSDPHFPLYWISNWTMYRVKTGYKQNPPPYSNPPATLKPSDYTVSYGTTYYDASYIPRDFDGYGAMMEHYEDYCLPIFPIKNNNYTCTFISLGNKAYFLTYPEDRPKNMPQCCSFSPWNHPPRQDFIKHLSYSEERSKHLFGTIQAYAEEVPAGPEKILFGYAFYKQATADDYVHPPYRHPQSFYFSGDTTKANAPIVSQNYTNFRFQKPDPRYTWDRVAQMCPTDPVDCQLFDYSPDEQMLEQNQPRAGWDTLNIGK